MGAMGPLRMRKSDNTHSLFQMMVSKATWTNIILFLLFYAVLMQVTLNQGLAQAPDDDSWSTPVNLSQSGGTTNPVIVEDASGVVHVVWQDASVVGDEEIAARSGYASNNGDEWDTAHLVEFPFSPYVPLLVADINNWVHAFWIDGEGSLLASRVSGSIFGDAAAWEPAYIVAPSALNLDAVVNEDGEVHLVYLKPVAEEDIPAGVYYRRTRIGRPGWEPPVPLYTSGYFRSLSDEEANLEIEYAGIGEESVLYVVWDNRPRKQVLLVRSHDQGESWTPTQVIAGPEPGLGNLLPYNLQVSAQERDVLLIWQVGGSGSSCIQYYQNSTNNGETWHKPQQMFRDFTGCPKDNQIYTTDAGLTVLMTSLFDWPYLTAWDDTQWSDPQPQDTLAGFEDPDVYTQVTLDCLQGESVVGDRLFIVGCDLGNGGDTWATVRRLDENRRWFPPDPLWSELVEITNDSHIINTPILLADGNDRLHAIWTQVDKTDDTSDHQAIYYTRWEGNLWSQPLVIQQSQSGNTRLPSVLLDRDGRMMLTWNDSRTGELFFSWADAGWARYQTEWAPSLALPVVKSGVSGHDLLAADDGSLYIAYSLPLNEERGVYLIRSIDGGVSWSSLKQVFDGQDRGWEMVGPPQLTQTADGILHLLCSSLPLPGGTGLVSLHYTNSDDGGQSWSEEFQVNDTTVVWSRLVSEGERTVHLIWMEEQNDNPVFNHRVSYDSGLTRHQDSFTIFNDLQGHPDVISDPFGRLHVLLTVEDYDGKLEMQHWKWDYEHWSTEESLDLDRYQGSILNQVVAAVAPKGSVEVVISGVLPKSIEDDETANFLAYTSRLLPLPEDNPESLPIATATPTLVTEQELLVTETPLFDVTPTPTPIGSLPGEWEEDDGQGTGPLTNKWIGVVMGGALGLIIVLIAFAVRFLRIRVKG